LLRRFHPKNGKIEKTLIVAILTDSLDWLRMAKYDVNGINKYFEIFALFDSISNLKIEIKSLNLCCQWLRGGILYV